MDQSLALKNLKIATRIDRRIHWTDAQKEYVLDLFNQRWSMSRIGDSLGCTRNCIAGLIRRLRKEGGINGKMIEYSRFKDGLGNKRQQTKELFVVKSTIPMPPPLIIKATKSCEKKVRIRLRVVDNTTEVTIHQLKSHMCKWPLGDPRSPDFRYCGKPREGKHTPYCTEHTILGIKPAYKYYGTKSCT